MANTIDERGFFWWLNEPSGQTNSLETSVRGSLSVSQEGHIKLNLDGALWYADPPEPLPWGESRLLPPGKWIVGKLDTDVDGNGDHILLDGLKRTDFLLGGNEPHPQNYEAKICITNNSPYNVDFNFDNFYQLRVELVGLEEWLNLNSILEETVDRNDGNIEVRVKYTDHKLPYTMNDGDILIESMTFGADTTRIFARVPVPVGELTFKQRNWLVYTPRLETNFDSLRHALTRIEEPFALFLGSYFQLDWPTFIRHEEGDDFGSWHRVYFFRGSVPEFKPNPFFWWVGFSKLRESFGKLLSAWKSKSEGYGSGYYLYLAELRNPLPYSEHRFVNLIWALESLHKKQTTEDIETPSAIERKERIESILKKLAGQEDEQDRKWFEIRTSDYQKDPKLSDRIYDCTTVRLFSKGMA